MNSTTKPVKIFSIPIRIHWSWLLIFGLVTLSLAQGYFPSEHPGLSGLAYWILGAVTGLLFFGSVLLHELGHSLVALRNGIPVRDITLFIFGGMAQIEREPKSAGAEFRIAVAGPLTSLVLAALFGLVWQWNRAIPYLASPSLWLMRINLALGAFNLIPGFPLDGGRVLRAVLWKLSGNFHRATQIASVGGQLVAFGFIGLGFLSMLIGEFFDGLWLAAIGWFLQNAATATSMHANMQQLLRGVTVGQVMSRECLFVSAQKSLDRLVEEQVLSGGKRCFFVGEGRRMLGLLTLADVAKIPKRDWKKTTVSEAMVPLERTVRIRTEDLLLGALKVMDDANVNQVPVMEGDEIAGVLSRARILHYVRTRAELGV